MARFHFLAALVGVVIVALTTDVASAVPIQPAAENTTPTDATITWSVTSTTTAATTTGLTSTTQLTTNGTTGVSGTTTYLPSTSQLTTNGTTGVSGTTTYLPSTSQLTTNGTTGVSGTTTYLPSTTWLTTNGTTGFTGTTGISVTATEVSGTTTRLSNATWTTSNTTEFTTPTAGVTVFSTGAPKDNCTKEQRDLSCELVEKYKKNLVLAQTHASGTVDQAFAINNLRDMCDGTQAARSNYPCHECPTGAPGGTVCIRESVLNYLAALADNGYVQVTELAGGCHSCNSSHYLGLAVDLELSKRNNEYLEVCKQMGGTGIQEPTFIHCEFNN